MLLPPKADDLAARMDPSKQRARGFNTGKGAKGPSQGKGAGEMNKSWTETAEEKRVRLRDEVLGVSGASTTSNGTSRGGMDGGKVGEVHEGDLRRKKEDEEKARRIREYNERHRSESLYVQHQGRREGKKEEDDPSKRGFDWEKDMSGGTKVGHKQRSEMLKRAGDFGSRFGGGKYL